MVTSTSVIFGYIAILVSMIAPTVSSASSSTELTKSVLPQVVTIRIFDSEGIEMGFGSGFKIGNGEIATNAHVVAGGAWAEILDVNGRLLGTAPYATLVSMEKDLAVLPMPGDLSGGLLLSLQDAEVGENILVFGAPMGLEGTVSAGIVSAVREFRDVDILQITAPISSGSSGGPVVNETGQVIGVIVAMLSEGQNLNFAVPAGELRTLLEQPRGRIPFPSREDLNESEESDDIEPLVQLTLGLILADSVSYGGNFTGLIDEDDIDIVGPTDIYRFVGLAGQDVDIRVTSNNFDAVLELALGEGIFTEDSWSIRDDDSGDGNNPRIVNTLPVSGNYFLFVYSYDSTGGAYQLSLGGFRDHFTHSSDVEERWEHITRTDDSEVYYDKRTIDRRYSEITVWLWWRYNEIQTHDNGETYDSRYDRYEIDCRNMNVQLISYTIHYQGQTVLSQEIPPYSQSWQSAPPGSVGEAVVEAVCID